MQQDADKFKMDLIGGLERTLHGQVKPMITQCSMRHLYAASSEPGVSFVIDKAKMFERRRCGHLPDDYPEPLSARDCIKSVVDGKGNGTNKHRYVVASQDLEVRKSMRAVQGVPLVYINRSVMIMEPMAGTSAEVREREEKSKFRQGIKSGRASGSLKRKRGDGGEEEEEASAMKDMGNEDGAAKKKKKAHGPKGPNPLAVKKSKKKVGDAGEKADDTGKVSQDRNTGENTGAEGAEPAKRKRKRLHSKKKPGNEEVGGTKAEAATSGGRCAVSNMPESVETTTNATTNGNVNHVSTITNEPPELDDFGLPVKKHVQVAPADEEDADGTIEDRNGGVVENGEDGMKNAAVAEEGSPAKNADPDSGDEEFKDARTTPQVITPNPQPQELQQPSQNTQVPVHGHPEPAASTKEVESKDKEEAPAESEAPEPSANSANAEAKLETSGGNGNDNIDVPSTDKAHNRESSGGQGISEWSHQHITVPPEPKTPADGDDDEWQTMPAYAPYDIYDDDNKLIAREAHESDEEEDAYAGLGGAGRGYTRVQLDEDAQSATSLDENTQYLFKDVHGTGAGEPEDEEQRDALSQMQATKDLLTEGQRIAYVGMTRLILSSMVAQVESIAAKKSNKKELQVAVEATKMWSQKMMVRLYAHMEISAEEQVMIEQLAEHGVVPSDLTGTLMQNARVKNPMADEAHSSKDSIASGRSPRESVSSPRLPLSPSTPGTPRRFDEEIPAAVPPPYQEHEGDDLPKVRTPSQLPTTQNIDIDLRWTVLCDLFLTLIADSVYDSRSRTLLEKVGENMDVSWLEICRFEKRVTDALEMQQAAEKENWNEDEHKENRRKMALKKRYLMMGLATVGGSLVIGLSAGLLAPVIGAGLAAGFTTIGVAGTSGFLAGAGGAAIITSGAAASGGVIAIRAANRRTGAVKTFEYRPLHNNKRVNLIITVSGWMTGKVDDVRLPYSTVDPIMGDIYSVLWEPEMLTSMGDTINILATEALTQGLQQVLGSTILIGLMAALQLPVVLTKLSYLIDNPWTVSLDRANAAGLILADSLIDRNLGTRPITFVGYSLGSRVIFSCLKELAKKGAYGLVQNVYLFGSPIVAKQDEYLKARSVVAGRFVNGYARNDWILGYLFRLTSGGIRRVAGLAPVEGIPGLENVDVTDLVPGHMAYRTAMPKLLREVGWLVESDEFTEIEDPDPENHAERQRELINEIEEARKEFEKKEKEGKGRFSFFGRKKKTAVERKEWEMYEESSKTGQDTGSGSGSRSGVEDGLGNNHGVFFDVDAIRAELASEHMEVKELKSTLPPMKLNLASGSNNSNPSSPRDSLRPTKSGDPSSTLKTYNYHSPAHSPRPSNGAFSHSHSYTNSNSHSRSSLHSNSYHAHPMPEEELEMTFDTAYRSPPTSATTSHAHLPPSRSNVEVAEQRPELKSASTTPVGLGLAGYVPERNAWADDDEDEFGEEKEMTMTFA
ncbi:DUF726 domain protein [Rutstroemia sp. NJR-2017a BVV2]|nr:DUF726 domain protein [Rutstroemia sp. NJR-2017a BVV2]